MSAAARTVMVSQFDLRYPPENGTRAISFRLPALSQPAFALALVRLLRTARAAQAVFVSNPKTAELLFLYTARMLCGRRLKIVVFDLIMRVPATLTDRLLAPVKRRLLTAIDVFAFIHKETSGYQRWFGVPPERCRYIPFKANNFDHADKFTAVDGDYAVSLGASHRDYRLLIDAVRGLDIHVKIIVPKASIELHNAAIDSSNLPPNVEHICDAVDRDGWSRYIAGSRFVVVPLLPGVMQPAGISVYLEAMVLGKPVIITRGSSTEGILDDSLAVLVPAADVPAMRAAILELWNDAGRRHSLGVNARRYALGLKDHSRLVADLRAVVDATISAPDA
jgi:glycosyltransferase involved in cell wall biosynthesis